LLGLEDTTLLALGAAVVMASVHVFSPWLAFLDKTPRSIWLSIAGGISVAYVFVHLFPELARLQEEHFGATGIDAFLYLFAVVGLVAYYGLEQLAKHRGGGPDRKTPAAVFWLHLGSFAFYNMLIGYLLEEQARLEGAGGMALYAIAMAVHFVVNDRALYRHHGTLYLAPGRWILAVSAFAGWALGLVVEIDTKWIACCIALLAGSVTLNVIKEELPEEREARFWAFALGAASYAGLLVV
jgi:hypothetical protein